ncbi:ribosomal subunit interface protein, partial [Streptomyces albidoflavus]
MQKEDAPPLKRSDPGTEFCVDIVVKGRKTEVPERFRKHVA